MAKPFNILRDETVIAQSRVIRELRATITALQSENERLRERVARYDELLLAVANKYPAETRHETALRYIRSKESMSGVAQSAQPKETHNER